MATKDRTALKDEFKNGNLATGERFADLIDSMKVVQEPVEDPAASGTSLSFIASIEQNADGKITATKKTLDLANAHEINPFKGWWKTGDTLPTSGFDGAYLYFKDTDQTPAVTTIFRWNGTGYADTGVEVDESNVQTFETGQAVNGVAIDGTGLANPLPNALAKAEDARTVLKQGANLDMYVKGAFEGSYDVPSGTSTSNRKRYNLPISLISGHSYGINIELPEVANVYIRLRTGDITLKALTISSQSTLETTYVADADYSDIYLDLYKTGSMSGIVFRMEDTTTSIEKRLEGVEGQAQMVEQLQETVDEMSVVVNGEEHIGAEYEVESTEGVKVLTDDNTHTISISHGRKFRIGIDTHDYINSFRVYFKKSDGSTAAQVTVNDTSYTNYALGPTKLYQDFTAEEDIGVVAFNSSNAAALGTGTTVVNIESMDEPGLPEKVNSQFDKERLAYYKALHGGQFLDIAYSAINALTLPPPNSEPYFREMIKKGFNGLKADMRLTSDGKIVLCHDDGYTFNGEGKITTFDTSNKTLIHDLTLAEVESLTFSRQWDGEDVHPCTLETFLVICKHYNVVPYLTFRDEYHDATCNGFFRLLKRLDIVGNTIINLFPADTRTTGAIAAYGEPILVCDTRLNDDTITTSIVDQSVERGCSYICVHGAAITNLGDEIIQYGYSKGISFLAYANSGSVQYTIEELLQKGIVGVQQYNPTQVIDTVQSVKALI